MHDRLPPKGMCLGSRDFFNFGEMTIIMSRKRYQIKAAIHTSGNTAHIIYKVLISNVLFKLTDISRSQAVTYIHCKSGNIS